MTAKIAVKVALKMVKTLMISGAVIAACIVVMQFNMAIGIILMMLYSSFMVINSSRKEMPLNKFTALLPGVMSIITFLIMLQLIQLDDPVMPMIGMGIGVVVGFLMARGHKVYEKKGIIYAKRTFFYILIWALSMLFTQGSTLAGMRGITDFGFLLNGFSMACMVILSIFLLYKNSKILRKNSHLAVMIYLILPAFTLICLMAPVAESWAAEEFTKQKISQLCNNERWICPGDFDVKTRLIMCNEYGMNCPLGPVCLGHQAICNNARTNLGDSRYSKMVWDKNEDGFCDICGDVYGMRTQGGPLLTKYRDYKYILSGNGYHTCKDISDDPANNFTGSTSGHSPLPNLQPDPEPIHPPSPEPVYSPHSDFEFSDDEATAGGLIALLMLLTGVGMNAAANAAMSGAMTAAQEAANAATQAGQAATGDGSSADYVPTGNRILEGSEAEDWMKDKDNGYFDENGNKTEKFDKFIKSMPSEPGPGLQGFGGKLDAHNNPIGDYIIIVPNETPSETSQAHDSRDTDEQPESTNNKNQDQSTDSSASDSDDAADDKKQTSGSPAKEGSKSATEPKDSQAKPPVEQPPPIEYPNAREDLEKVMNENIKQKVGDNYFVRNPNLLNKAWNNTLGWLINEKIGDYKGGQCGDFAEYGADWSREDIKKLFGKDVYVTKILAKERATSSMKDDLGGYFWEINHAATRVVLPNGEKYVLDYWEGMQNKKSAVYKEADWIKKQKNNLDYRNCGVIIDYTPDETHDQDVLKDNIENHGEKEGKKKYFDYQKNPTKARTTIEAWEADPW